MATGKQQGLQAMARMLSAVVVMLLLGLVAGELVDIKPYFSLILERHNELRKGVSPAASDMREMVSVPSTCHCVVLLVAVRVAGAGLLLLLLLRLLLRLLLLLFVSVEGCM